MSSETDPELAALLGTVNKPASNIKVGASFAKHKIIVLSGKGGVGKSTVAANLAAALATMGYQTGIIDTDMTGPSIPKMLGIEHLRPEVREDKRLKPVPVPTIPNLQAMSLAFFLKNPDVPVIWRGSMKFKAIRQFLYDIAWESLDYLVFDLPPGTSDEPLTIAQQLPDVDGAIIVTTPQDVATLDVRKAINFLRELKIRPLGVIENMSGFRCPHCKEVVNIFGKNGGRQMADSMGVRFLGSVPIDPGICESGDSGQPFVLEGQKYAMQQTTQIFREMVLSLTKILDDSKKAETPSMPTMTTLP